MVPASCCVLTAGRRPPPASRARAELKSLRNTPRYAALGLLSTSVARRGGPETVSAPPLPPLAVHPLQQRCMLSSLMVSFLCPPKGPNPSGTLFSPSTNRIAPPCAAHCNSRPIPRAAHCNSRPTLWKCCSSRTLAGAPGCTQGVRGKTPPSLLSNCLWVLDGSTHHLVRPNS